jgi:hypothetical protein
MKHIDPATDVAFVFTEMSMWVGAYPPITTCIAFGTADLSGSYRESKKQLSKAGHLAEIEFTRYCGKL